MKPKYLTNRFLEGLAETIDSLNGVTDSAFFNPSIAVLSVLILTGIASFSYDFRLLTLIFFISVMLILISHSPMHIWFRVITFIFIWATAVSVPIPFITRGDPLATLSLGVIQLTASSKGVYLMITFILRVVTSAAIFTSFASIIGWRGIIRGLEGLRIPRELTLLLNLLIIHIPLFLREASKMLSAREARIVRRITFKEVWKILATVVGDLLLRSREHAWRLEKAIRARSFTAEFPLETMSTPVRIKDLFLLSLTLTLLLLRISYGL